MPKSSNGTFEFTEETPFSGVPVINGHRVLTAEQITVDVSGVGTRSVTLKLMAFDGLKVVLSEALIHVEDETREALISLGWTPPDA